MLRLILSLIFVSSVLAQANVCSRHPLVVKDLERAANKSCKNITPADLAQVERLLVFLGDLTGISSSDFEGLTGLRWLSFLHTQNTVLPEDLLKNLNLYAFHVTNSDIKSLPAKLLENQKKLTEFEMVNTALESIPPELFDGLDKLENVLFSFSRNIRSYPPNLLKNRPTIKSVGLWCDCQKIPEGFLDGVTSLEGISIEGPQILPESLFRDTKNLSQISITFDGQTIPEKIFNDLPKLEKFRMSARNSYELPEGMFQGSTNLVDFDIAHMKIREISPRFFSGMTHLKNLEIEFTDLEEWPAGISEDLSSVEKLTLRQNKISKLSHLSFRGLNSVVDLILSSNDLGVLQNDLFSEIPHLKGLDLGTNKALVLSKNTFRGLKSLVGIEMIGGGITELPPGVFDDLTSTQYIGLNVNQIKHLDENLFINLVQIKWIDLRNNQLDSQTKAWLKKKFSKVVSF
jgi:Leucine-rich repeat (LRR) protein